ncbi:Diaminopimelate epimerase [Posidoniimonas corsicana]|uniref:Diaminopimelate epimerase n=1 Tax=Posidoniimonas corsicana TaxID=1938618 RepID=A0A5C5VHT7_9BACT|nr:diaminopimelate epimerase [Posidoniimonas corsicana]TWT37439.1 Diaminopimelate epimerase [Posidoniimonas corsicana]
MTTPTGCEAKRMRFTKMHGAGNDYVYVNGFSEQLPDELPSLARAVSDRRFGVGGDGLILILPSDTADVRMRMFNADGSEAEMCGNGIRCVVKYAYDHGLAPQPVVRVETLAGVLTAEAALHDGKVDRVRVDMGEPRLSPPQIPTTLGGEQVINTTIDVDGRSVEATCVSMGNPHCVVFVDSATDDLVLGLGPKLEKHAVFPEGVNVEFVEVLSPTEVRQRTWERGSGETWACGTGASAVCVAGVLTGRTERRILNHLIGGDLELEWSAGDGRVRMTGPAVEVFSGEWPS